jgi:hypothetical protein
VSARRRKKLWRVFCRLDDEIALVATSVDARRARQLAQTLRAQHYVGARIWVGARDRPVSTSWNRLRKQLLSREQDASTNRRRRKLARPKTPSWRAAARSGG